MKNVTLSLLGFSLILLAIYIATGLNSMEIVSLILAIAGVIICIVAAVKSAKNDE